MEKSSYSVPELNARYLALANAYSTSRYSEKGTIMASQIGFLAGLLARYAVDDIAMKQELKRLEKFYQVDQKR
jgi:hypothetical protein